MRVQIPVVATDAAGNAVAGASVSLVNRETGQPPVVYQAETGPATRTLPLTTQANGRPLESWVDRAVYTVTVTAASIGTDTFAWDASSARDGAVDALWLGSASVGSDELVDGAVTNIKLAAAAVSMAKIADGAVTAPKLANDAVTTGKLLNSAVTALKIADGNITEAKFSGSALDNVLRVSTGPGYRMKFGTVDAGNFVGDSTYDVAGMGWTSHLLFFAFPEGLSNPLAITMRGAYPQTSDIGRAAFHVPSQQAIRLRWLSIGT